MASRTILIIISSLLLMLSITNASVDSTCKNTPNPQLCSSILRQDPQSNNKDTRGHALWLANALKSRVESSLQRFGALKLERCSKLYKIVLDNSIPEIFEALKKGNPKFAENGVMGTAAGAEECERISSGSNAQISNINKPVIELANIARAVVRLLL